MNRYPGLLLLAVIIMFSLGYAAADHFLPHKGEGTFIGSDVPDDGTNGWQ